MHKALLAMALAAVMAAPAVHARLLPQDSQRHTIRSLTAAELRTYGHRDASCTNRTSGRSFLPSMRARETADPDSAPKGSLLAIAALAGLTATALSWEGLPPPVIIHGTLMVTAWAGLLPAGALIARYCKVTRRQRFPEQLDNRFWWNWHRCLQYAGVALSAIGLAAILFLTSGDFGTLHGKLGLGLVLLSIGQVIGPMLRGSKGGPTDPAADPTRPDTWRGDHFDMTDRRLAFERWHKTMGWMVLIGGSGVILLGVALIGMPHPLMIVIGATWVVLLAVALNMVKERRWVDTYVAIWGPSMRSPWLRPGAAPATETLPSVAPKEQRPG